MGEAKRKKDSGISSLRINKGLLTTIIVVVCILAVVFLNFTMFQSPAALLSDFDPQRTKGPVAAPLQILEFADFQCSECARGSGLLKSFMSRFPDQIRLSMKYYPLGELNSKVSAIYAECAADQDKFWPYHDLLFERQNQWRKLYEVENYLTQLAAQADLDVTELGSCVKQSNVTTKVIKEKMLGESHFVRSTPTYFINEEMFVGVEALRSYLEEYFASK